MHYIDMNAKAHLEEHGQGSSSYDFSTLLGIGGMGAVYKQDGKPFGLDGNVAVKWQAIPGDLELPTHKKIVQVGADYLPSKPDTLKPGELVIHDPKKKVAKNLSNRDVRLLQYLIGERESLKRFNGRTEAVVGFYGDQFLNVGGKAYSAMAMECLEEGDNLRTLIRNGFNPHLNYTLISSLGNAVLGLQSEKIVHQDIKPDNVFVRPDGSVKLFDFGLAKLLRYRPQPGDPQDIGELLREKVPTEDSVWGTVGYGAPSQFRGHFDPTADIFSTGMTAYAILLRRDPRLVAGGLMDNVLKLAKYSHEEQNKLLGDLACAKVPQKVTEALGKAIHPSSRKRTLRPLLKQSAKRATAGSIYEVFSSPFDYSMKSIRTNPDKPTALAADAFKTWLKIPSAAIDVLAPTVHIGNEQLEKIVSSL